MMFEADHGCAGYRWPVVRLRAHGETEVILLSEIFFTLTTHWNRVTIPCAGEPCALCELLPSRGLFYVAVMCASRLSLLELGAVSALDFEQHSKLLHGGMVPGLVFALSRRTAKSPVRSECIRRQDGVRAVSLLDLARHVMALYKFPPPNPEEPIGSYETRCREIAWRRNGLTAAALLRSKTVDT